MSKNAWKTSYYKGPKKKKVRNALGGFVLPIERAPKEVRDRIRLEKWRKDMETYGVDLPQDF